MLILGTIAARAGSTGLPGKNIHPLLGKPLIVWTIEQALATAELHRVVVSTDSPEIAAIARDAGAAVPFLRPKELAGPEVGKFQVWKYILAACEEYYREQYECLVDLDCTGPLREPADIFRAIQQFLRSRHRGVDAVFSVSAARRNPYFNQVEPDELGVLKMSKPTHPVVVCRQEAPPVYDHIGSIYVLDAQYVRRANHLLEGHAEGYDIGVEKSYDIDALTDFAIVECLMRRKLGVATP